MTNTPDPDAPEITAPDTAWWNQNYQPDARTLDFVDMAMRQVEGCRDYLTKDEALPGVLRVACIESFWVNVRLLTEYLVKFTTHADDIHVHDLVPNWEEPVGEVADRLKKDWITASKHVMHFSKQRTPEDLADITPVSNEDHERIARDLRTVYDQFCQAAGAPH
ncbi:hypothetical protein ACFC0K_15740 [Streptomyces hydrogenans]|uniref:hypothetical protein n=1 Tax=Streptomyces hydrogenans TaxID=1873719 RepID=UPI0035DB7785